MNKSVPFRQTKIIAPIGPASDDVSILTRMIQAGMNVARLNLSHGTHEAHRDQITRLRVAASQVHTNIAIMIDTRGIEVRTGLLQGDTATLVPGERFCLHTKDKLGDVDGVSITYLKLFEEVKKGTPILLDDGAIELEVEEVIDGVINCRIIHGGQLGNSKSVNLPETELALSSVSPEYREDVARELTFAAASRTPFTVSVLTQLTPGIANPSLFAISNSFERSLPWRTPGLT